jgi:pimeloyl-ACP methyl ester carboxylesterase
MKTHTIDHVMLEANGLRFHARVAGPVRGPLVLLLHGFPESSYGWRRQMEPLAAAGLRVVAPDQRGYGLSSKPQERFAYQLDTLADDVVGIARALGAKRYAVVGHDWGGAVAWHLASRGAEGLERVAILNAPHAGTVGRHTLTHPGQALKGSYVGFFQLPVIPELVLSASDFLWLRRALVSTSRKGCFSEEELDAYREDWQRAGALTGMLNWYRALPLHMPVPTGRVQIPVRVLWGDRDTYLDPELAELGAEMCEKARVTHFSDATHWLHHEEPEKVNEALRRFLREGAA